MFSAVIAGYISGSLFPASCESAGLSHCRPPRSSPPPHNSVMWGHCYALPESRPFVKPGDPTNTEGNLQLDLQVLWLLFHCSVFSVNRALERVKGQSTSGLMVIWECKDNLILRGLLPWDLYGSFEKLNECSDAQLCESSNEVRFMT